MNYKGINSKQAMILTSLLVLLLGVGVLAHNVNTKLENGDLALTMKEQGKEEEVKKEETKSDGNYFYETRSVREQEDEKAIETLKAIIADENTSKDQKDSATENLTDKTTNRDLESRIELEVKSKGYKDAICFLDGEKARVVVAEEKLTEEKVLEIQDIVKKVAQVYDVQIEAK
ncbi:SpoIIIAH-like family protein [uncultured Clostridium sp.]|uniref:SpoIIIAH-like family protein n=1 Tax=uncultured Clostridium sp. TaxID=59620 RepID=UPI00260F089D|nr:SpoIIIAH-like family protein [uncultured Clostridium sp.]